MCELFAISSKVPTKVTFSLDEFSRHGGQTARHRFHQARHELHHVHTRNYFGSRSRRAADSRGQGETFQRSRVRQEHI